MLGGDFEDAAGREVTWELLEVHDYEGAVYSEGDMEDHLHHADRAFYSVTVGGEQFYRWVAGPFESIGDLESAISDEGDFYSEVRK